MIIDWPRVNKRLTGAEGGLDGAVDLGDDDLLVALGLLVLDGQVLPGWVEPLAVAAPGKRKKYNIIWFPISNSKYSSS